MSKLDELFAQTGRNFQQVSAEPSLQLPPNGRGAGAAEPVAATPMSKLRTIWAEGGDVTVTSEPGKGSVFTVRLPSGPPN